MTGIMIKTNVDFIVKMLYNISMITIDDIKRLTFTRTNTIQIRRINNAETSCKNATTDWAKNYWYNVFKKLCKKYNCMDYFRKVIH